MNPAVIQTFVLGPLENNTCLLGDTLTRQAVIVDPSLGCESILPGLQAENWQITQIWLTHAHFDHTAGIESLCRALGAQLPIGLHPADLPLYQDGGGAKRFGFHNRPGPAPSLELQHGQTLLIGETSAEVRHTPGHTPGHVIFYLPSASTALVGDVIFAGSVGRTDLPGGSHALLLESIRTQVLSLPPATRLISGHGPATSVEQESRFNPYLRGMNAA